MSNNTEPAGIDFLDFLFTVAMSIGLTPELLQLTNEGIRGLLLEGWANDRRVPTPEEWFNIGVFILGFLTLTLSWFGYHAALSRRPHKYDSGKDMVRFVLDVLLVILYGVMMLQFKSINVVILVLLIVFFDICCLELS